ncbi:chloride/fluoride channel protein [Abditibacteriota bacterium]|nr:chloride/fluoride channel protein [Abditibacteriota bacterium]
MCEWVRVALIVLPIALATGAACALFLWLLDEVTKVRFAHPALLFALPVGGVVIAYLYEWHGKESGRGNNLILEAIHSAQSENPDDDSSLVPRRMAPLILVTTLLTHLFGGSAGREGTAVQMGGSLAAGWALVLKLEGRTKRLALLCGVAAGFGGVFGTPLAGAVFALEVLWHGRLETEEILLCLLAAMGSDWCAKALGAHHVHYKVVFPLAGAGWFDVGLAAKVAFAAVLFGLAARAFVELTEAIGHVFKTRIPWPLARPVVGGLLVIGLTFLVGTRDYLGLSVLAEHPGAITLPSAFDAGGATPFSWLWKTVFTALTLGSGFKGGEVTPLFFIGATLGNTLSGPLHAPVALLAAVGFVAVFAGASKTPLASAIMGIELFGAGGAPLFALACFIAMWASGAPGIYQRPRPEEETRGKGEEE